MSFEHRVTRLAGVTPRPYRPMSGLPTRHSFRRPFERRFPRTEARSFPVTLDGRRSSPRDPYRGPEASSATSLDSLTGKPFPCGQHFGPFIVELFTAGISPDAGPCQGPVPRCHQEEAPYAGRVAAHLRVGPMNGI